MQFEALAEPPEGTRLTLNVTAPPVVFVTVNLSMIVLQFVDGYWVVCAFSACFGGMIFFAVIAIIVPLLLFLSFCYPVKELRM